MPDGFWICRRCHRAIPNRNHAAIDQHKLGAWLAHCEPHASKYVHDVADELPAGGH